MKIDSVECFLVRLPFRAPQRMADKPLNFIDTVVTKITAGDKTGWSEVAPGNTPCLTSEWSGGVFQTIRDVLLPLLKDRRTLAKPSQFVEELATSIQGNQHAKAAIDMALWDLAAREKGEPLWKTLGGVRRDIPLGLTFDRFEEPADFFPELQRLVADGFSRATLKFRPGWDIQAVTAARSELPFGVQLQVDIESALTFDKYAEIFYRLEDFFLTFIEQPSTPGDQVALAMIQNSLRTPLCLDESIGSELDAEIAADLKSAKFFCVKPGRVGGHTESQKILNAARQEEISCYAGCEFLSSLGYRHLVALASLPGFTHPCDYLRFDEVLEADLTQPVETTLIPRENPSEEHPKTPDPIRAAQLWDTPGTGCEIATDVLESCTIARCEL
ncbi:MAG: enolase C-terminal domain-like protein [Planctomycetia bacterium]|nr:enolase C-terminal domain-like protein [Planctomycetia bacterium]